MYAAEMPEKLIQRQTGHKIAVLTAAEADREKYVPENDEDDEDRSS